MLVCGVWPATVCAFQIIRTYWFAASCDETEPEYELRFDADDDYVRELIDRIDDMSLRGVKLCNRCTEKHPGCGGKWQEKPGRAQCAECRATFRLQKAATVSRRIGRGVPL